VIDALSAEAARPMRWVREHTHGGLIPLDPAVAEREKKCAALFATADRSEERAAAIEATRPELAAGLRQMGSEMRDHASRGDVDGSESGLVVLELPENPEDFVEGLSAFDPCNPVRYVVPRDAKHALTLQRRFLAVQFRIWGRKCNELRRLVDRRPPCPPRRARRRSVRRSTTRARSPGRQDDDPDSLAAYEVATGARRCPSGDRRAARPCRRMGRLA